LQDQEDHCKQKGDRKIPEIGDPAVEEKLNRLTIGQRGNIKRHRKPDITSARKSTIARPRGAIRPNGSLDISNGEAKHTADVTKLVSRSRLRRPPGFKHQFRPSHHQRKAAVLPKSIKRMRIKSQDKKVDAVVLSNEESEELNPTVNPRTIRPSRLRVHTGRRAPTTHTSPIMTHSVTPVRRLRNPTSRRGHSKTTTTTTTTTTEKITISPNAHKISYTLNGSEYVDITSANPILMDEDIQVVSNSLEHEPGQPHAEELNSAPYLIPESEKSSILPRN